MTRLATTHPTDAGVAAIRHLLRTPSRLSVGHWARDSYGRECDVFADEAVAFDVVGAAYRVSGGFDDGMAETLIAAIEGAYGSDLQGVTSRLGHGEILALIDRAIEGKKAA